ncbi:MAG: hypothetical protein K2N12_04430 [Helicobacter sp.]|nr:hypothetical protein [Helicobacter sp.]
MRCFANAQHDKDSSLRVCKADKTIHDSELPNVMDCFGRTLAMTFLENLKTNLMLCPSEAFRLKNLMLSIMRCFGFAST